jgi:transcriptional regulator with XRE-family HTH domain
MNLKQLKESKNMTVQQLADAAGLPKRTVEDIMRRGDCLVSNAIKLADVLGVTLDELCRDKAE